MVSLGLGSDVSNHKGLKHLEASRHIFSSQCIQNRHQSLAGRCKLLFLQKTIRSRQINSPIQDDSPSRLVARPVRSAAIVRSRQRQDKTNGGAERDRTADPLLAKQVLSQLSYSPIQLDHPSLINQARQQFASTNSLNPVHHSHMQMVGPGRLELPTPRLSSVCSNQLSYGPIPVPVDAAFVFLKKEKRGRRTSPYHPSAKHFRGVLRCDGRLTGAIYVLKSTGRFILIMSGVLPVPQLP